MSTAVIIFTYNEAINLPKWVDHYSKEFGRKSLFVVDRSSSDNSTALLEGINLITIPRKEFDEFEKTDLINSLQHSLLNAFETVIITDCDELLVVDPEHYSSLSEYLAHNDFEHMNAIGLEVHHILDTEPPLDQSLPFLSQRAYAKFQSPSCKKLISRVPLRYLNGFHSCDKAPCFDGKLFMIHTKVIDYHNAMLRQKINIDTVWSQRSTEAIPESHHKYNFQKFFHQNFLVPLDLIARKEVFPFEFQESTSGLVANTEFANGFFYIPMNMRYLVKIPERFSLCL